MANKESFQTGVVMFDNSKRELGLPDKNLTRFASYLKSKFRVATNQSPISLETIAIANLVVMAGPRDMFSLPEFDAIKTYVQGGGNLFIMFAEGGETKLETNLNYLLEEYGISVNSDCVIRTVYNKKHFHPKENAISNGIINREIANFAKGKQKPKAGSLIAMNFAAHLLKNEGIDTSTDHGGLEFLFPYGASLNVQSPAIPILSSGPLSYPINRPIGAVYTNKTRNGRILVLGSYEIFSDNFIEKEENMKLLEILLKWLTGGDVELDLAYEEENDLQEYSHVPDVASLAGTLKSCLQTSENLSSNFRSMFDESLFKFDTDVIPEVLKLFDTMGVKHEAITLIPPQFEAPLPSLMPAVFPSNLKEPQTPSLDLFDLDEEFASEQIKLAQLSNKYSDADVEYYIRECGDLMGVSQQIERLKFGYGGDFDAKAILHHILVEVVNYKKHID